ncbi:MAG: chemotaxis-specific protein-glutamate methyltransferase CheB [Legionellales bacterium]|nr:chemotaxis-specific protein-glutamate methyltransferase CheB [Legionellales bacterium]
MIKLLIVDDSNTELAILKHIFEQDKTIEIVGYAQNGKEAVTLVPILKPDIVTMDIQMPVMDGLLATRCIMSEYPVPIVIISSKLNELEMGATFQAFEAGALAVIDKPLNIAAPEFEQTSKRIIAIIHSMAEIKTIKHRFSRIKKEINLPSYANTPHHLLPYELVVIGASIGGPQALKNIFSALSDDFSAPILVVQHMTIGFINGFVKWLDNEVRLTVKIAENHEPLKKGTIYFAPDGYHLGITNQAYSLTAKLFKGAPEADFCPSITELFKSVATIYPKKSIGVLLTGMGNDGAQGLLSLRQAGGHTIIQDAKSAVVFGMPGVAASLNAVDKVVELEKIGDYLTMMTRTSSGSVRK